jgi:hypothetical protein
MSLDQAQPPEAFLEPHAEDTLHPIIRWHVDNFVARVRQLYEREPGEGVSARLGAYVRRWVRWVTAGVPAVESLLPVFGGAGPSPHRASPPRGILPSSCCSHDATRAIFSTWPRRSPLTPRRQCHATSLWSACTSTQVPTIHKDMSPTQTLSDRSVSRPPRDLHSPLCRARRSRRNISPPAPAWMPWLSPLLLP